MNHNQNISESGSFTLFCDPLILPWGNLFKESFTRLYKISGIANIPVKIDIHEEKGIPVVKCYTGFSFTGLENHNSGLISGDWAGPALTEFLLGHLHFALKNSKEFTNMPLLTRIEQRRGELLQLRNTTMSDEEALEIYKFLD